ncbi:ribosome biogenesis GTPase YqeH [Ligilactobacillus cholophilus]|uniref:ribosome biogenesis GTPase YqeH n=1 Tax=Ligilactobacillus cholophilus TaxID=3050131 RepID=UPI0025AF6D90|nr:ribosome biogenesis GTPase YqeH [Ligilactobacillus cholophilus]
MTDELRCIGCGAIIQTEDSDKAGYIPKSALEKQKDDIYCQRCFRLRHYNEIADVEYTDDDFLSFLNQLSQKDALIINVIDIFDFTGSIIPGLQRFVGNNPILMVGNKEDLLPKSLKRSRIKDWVRQSANKEGLRPIDVILTSAKKGFEIDQLLEKIEEYRNGRDVYVVGVTNVGKSTLINKIIQQLTGVKQLITTSKFPGTTLDRIEIPLDDGHFLIDTPGIIHRNQMAHYLAPKELRLVTPQKEIKPKVFQLQDQQTLFLSALARFDFISGTKDRNGIVVYLDNNLKIHRTKLINAEKFYQKHAGELLQPPTKDELETSFPKLVRYEFKTKEKSDLVFSGLGWITVPKDSVVAGWAPEGVGVSLRKAMI